MDEQEDYYTVKTVLYRDMQAYLNDQARAGWHLAMVLGETVVGGNPPHTYGDPAYRIVLERAFTPVALGTEVVE